MILLWSIKKVPFLWCHAIVYVSSAKLLSEGHEMSGRYDRKGESKSHDDSRGSHRRKQRKGPGNFQRKSLFSRVVLNFSSCWQRLRFWLGASWPRRDGGIFLFSGDAEVGLLESLVCSPSTSSGKACKHLGELETPHLLQNLYSFQLKAICRV